MSIKEIWNNYNVAADRLAKQLNRTNNIVGEYAECLTKECYNGNLLEPSHKSADVEVNGQLLQVKARKLKNTTSTQLGIIRSWDFNLLIVILFDKLGNIEYGIEVPVHTARNYATANKLQNGWVITTTQAFLNDKSSKDITQCLRNIP